MIKNSKHWTWQSYHDFRIPLRSTPIHEFEVKAKSDSNFKKIEGKNIHAYTYVEQTIDQSKFQL